MKTSAIILRVADFLKAFPPFCYLPEAALLELAQSGRVRFCEKGEILFEEGKVRDRWVFVVNKGALRLVRGAGENREFVDMRGAGDFVGAGVVLGEKIYNMTALVDEDSIIYALDSAVFCRVCAASPKAGRFLAIFFATDEISGAPGRKASAPQWVDGHFDLLREGMVAGPAACPIRQAAQAMAAADSSVFVVLDAEGRAAGVVTETDLRNEVATGRVPLDAPVGEIMHSPVYTVSKEVSPADSLLGMIRHNVRHLCVTEDGTGSGRALGMLTEREVAFSQGNNPLALVGEIRRCRSPQMLRQLGDRLASALLAALQTPENVPWCARLASEARRAMFRRAEAWAREAMAPLSSPWLFALAGSAGRAEPLTQTDFPAVILFEGGAESARAWMAELLERIDDLLDAAGFHPPRFDRSDSPVERIRSVEEWIVFFRDLVRDPLGGAVWRRMTFFDLAPLGPQPDLLDRVWDALRRELAADDRFIRILANDALGNLPPVTIFEGYAVEADGLLHETVDVKEYALAPVSDIARVFNLDGGSPAVTNTLDRLEAAAGRMPERAATLSGAARAFRIAQYFRAKNGLRLGTTGNDVRPALLTRTEQVLLKTAFRAIADLISFTSEHYGFED